MTSTGSRARGPGLPGLAAALGLLLGTTLLGPATRATVQMIPQSALRADGAADRKRTLDRQLNDLRETLEGTSKSLVDAVLTLRRARVDLVGAHAELGVAQAGLARATQRDVVLAGRLAVAQAAVDKAVRDLDTRQQQEADSRTTLGSLAREAYVSSGLSGLSIALNAQSPDQFADRVNLAETALRRQNGSIARLEVQQAETRARRSRLNAARIVVAGLKRQSGLIVQQRTAAQRAAASASARISALVAAQARSVHTIAAKRAAEQRRVAAMQIQENRLAALLRQRATAQQRANAVHRSRGFHLPTNGSGRLSYPVNAPITSGFGMRYHPILHIYRLHAGTDFGASCGTPVHAASPGRIVRAGWAGGYGNQVVIDHGMMRGRDIATSYNHLSRFVVRSGTVRRGQVIAYSGTTGLSTGCHLHFEVFVNGTHVNPMAWL